MRLADHVYVIGHEKQVSYAETRREFCPILNFQSSLDLLAKVFRDPPKITTIFSGKIKLLLLSAALPFGNTLSLSHHSL